MTDEDDTAIEFPDVWELLMYLAYWNLLLRPKEEGCENESR
jgi:hypothetical protein